MLDQKFKIYFFDIDGTLAESKGSITTEISDLLSRLTNHSKVALISGGTLEQIKKQVVNNLDSKANLNNLILLPTSGASLYFYSKNKWYEVYNNTIPETRVSEIEESVYKAFRKNKIPIPRKSYGERFEYRGSQITFSAFGQDAPIEVKSRWDSNHKKREKIVNSIKNEFEDLDIKIGGTSSIDFTLWGIDKSYGVNKLTEKLNILPSDCVFVGDAIFAGGNDYSVVKTGIQTILTSGPEESIDIIKALLKNRGYKRPFISIIILWLKKIYFYLLNIFKKIFNLFSPKSFDEEDLEENVYVTRSAKNPVLSPTSYSWENEGVFNPAAIYIGGKVHILYRAIGSNGISTIGYASSSDGIHFDERLPYPIYYPDAEFELDPKNKNQMKFNPDKYASGGSWTGCEDPKVCQIGDRIFLTYVAFSGWESVRIAMSSITVDDFLNKDWRWTKPILCTKRGVVSKSGGLFPEKVNGKYVFFQRIFPNILLDYMDDLRFFEDKLPDGKHQIPPSKVGWDSRKVSFGSTPIKTEYGWLVITHGVDDAKDHQYHMGAMILDLNNPEKVLYRTKKPILSPELWYENDWKPGVVYPCGAVNKDGTLLIYYGGGDKYVCVASAPMDQFLDSLLHGKNPKLKNNKLKFRK